MTLYDILTGEVETTVLEGFFDCYLEDGTLFRTMATSCEEAIQKAMYITNKRVLDIDVARV